MDPQSWIPQEILSIPHPISAADKVLLNRKYGITELHWACLTRNMAKAGDLLNRGTADLHKKTLKNISCLSVHDSKEIQGVTPLFLAARSACRALVDLLIEHGAVEDILEAGTLGDTSLHAAALSGDKDVMDLLLSTLAKTPLGSNNAIDQEGYNSRTPLHYAAGGGHKLVVCTLLEVGVNVSAPDKYGATAFHFAAGWGNSIDCMNLLKKGPVDEAKDNKHWTALHYAAGNGQLQIIEWLLKQGASINAIDVPHENTPLHLAARHHDVICILTDNGADSWVTNKYEEDAFWLAHKHKDDKAVKSHIRAIRKKDLQEEHKVDPFAKHGKHKATLLHYVLAYGTDEDMAWIVGLAAFKENVTTKINSTDDAKQTAVHWAAMAGNIEGLRILADHKADMNALDDDKRDALCLAIAYGKANVGFIRDFLALPTVELQIPEWVTHEKAARWIKEYYIHHNLVRPLSKLKKPPKSSVWSFITKSFQWVSDTFRVQQSHARRFGRRASMVISREAQPASAATTRAQPDSTVTFREAQPTTSNAGAYKILDDFPPFYLALHAKREDIANFMQEQSIRGSTWQDAVVNRRGEETQRTALHWATIHGELDIVAKLCTKRLFSKDLKPNLEDKYGKTPLHYAKELSHTAIERQLMERQDVKIHLEELYRDRQVYVDAANAVLVVAALIASVTFVGWLQPPLNYVTYYDMRLQGASDDAYASYAAVQQHVGVRVFWGFNCLSFMFAIAAVLAGLVGVVPVPNRYIATTVAHLRCTLWVASAMLTLSIVLVLGAFAAAGLTVLPPIFKYQMNMLGTITLGAIPCILLLAWFVVILYCVAKQSTSSSSLSALLAPPRPPKCLRHSSSRPWERKEYDAWFYNPISDFESESPPQRPSQESSNISIPHILTSLYRRLFNGGACPRHDVKSSAQ